MTLDQMHRVEVEVDGVDYPVVAYFPTLDSALLAHSVFMFRMNGMTSVQTFNPQGQSVRRTYRPGAPPASLQS